MFYIVTQEFAIFQLVVNENYVTDYYCFVSKYTCIDFFSSLFCCLTHLRSCIPSSPKVQSKNWDFVSRRPVLLLQGPSKAEKNKKH